MKSRSAGILSYFKWRDNINGQIFRYGKHCNLIVLSNAKSKNPGVVSIKKLCDGLEITVRDFFNTDLFDETEQEIKWKLKIYKDIPLNARLLFKFFLTNKAACAKMVKPYIVGFVSCAFRARLP